MVTGGIDALLALTVMYIECGFSAADLAAQGVYNSWQNPQGIFQFDPQAEVAPALAYWAEPATTWYTNNNYQSLAFFWNSVFWGMVAQEQGKYPDADGYNRYLVHNQGPAGARTIWNNTGALIGSLSVSLQEHMLQGINGSTGQSWSRRPPNRFNTPFLTTSNTVQDWLNNLTTAWNASKAVATGRLSSATLTNLNAFFSSIGGPAPVMSSAAIFGQPDIQLTGPGVFTFNDPTYGNFPGFLTNQGTLGPFTIAGPIPTTVPAHVIIGA
jgi:hypothetical protein